MQCETSADDGVGSCSIAYQQPSSYFWVETEAPDGYYPKDGATRVDITDSNPAEIVTTVHTRPRGRTPGAQSRCALAQPVGPGGPIIEIWKKWSITYRLDIPARSALRAMRPKVGPIDSGPPGQLK